MLWYFVNENKMCSFSKPDAILYCNVPVAGPVQRPGQPRGLKVRRGRGSCGRPVNAGEYKIAWTAWQPSEPGQKRSV